MQGEVDGEGSRLHVEFPQPSMHRRDIQTQHVDTPQLPRTGNKKGKKAKTHFMRRYPHIAHNNYVNTHEETRT